MHVTKFVPVPLIQLTRFELDRQNLVQFALGVTLTKEKRWRRSERQKAQKHIGNGLRYPL